jgi:hypothetical protein
MEIIDINDAQIFFGDKAENDEQKNVDQRIEIIPLNRVMAAAYQRTTNTKQVVRIMNNFNEAKLGVLIVSERDGNFYIVDGTHRVSALRRLGYKSAMFIVLEGLTYEQEADFFRRQNENTRQLTLYTRFKAGLESNDKLCKTINAIVERNMFVVGTNSHDFNIITAIWQELAQYRQRTTSNREIRIMLCRILVRHYNKGIAQKSNRYLKMEGWL